MSFTPCALLCLLSLIKTNFFEGVPYFKFIFLDLSHFIPMVMLGFVDSNG